MQRVYPASGSVSIWVGSFETEDDFDEEVDSILAPSLDLPCDIADICETTFKPEPTPIRVLLTGFSGDRSFIESAILVGEGLGICSGTAAIVCYHLAVSEDSVSERLHFLGTHSGTDILT